MVGRLDGTSRLSASNEHNAFMIVLNKFNPSFFYFKRGQWLDNTWTLPTNKMCNLDLCHRGAVPVRHQVDTKATGPVFSLNCQHS